VRRYERDTKYKLPENKMLLSSQEPDNNAIRVMIIDDNPTDLDIMMRQLARIPQTNYKLAAFTQIQQALEQLSVFKPDICLVDFSIGGYTAFDFLNGLGPVDERSFAVIVITGEPDEILDRELSEACVDDYWCKQDLNTRVLERFIRYAFKRHQLIKRTQQESQRKSQHLANMAHELKNPLGAVKGFAKILSKTLTDAATERQTQCLAMIEQNSNRINQLINELLDLSQIEAGKLQLHLQPINVFDIVDAVLEAFIPIAEEDGLHLQKAYTTETPLTTSADPDRLWQIVSNLVSNAIKYTEQGSITIDVEQLDLADLGNCICISVKDSGIGIRVEDFAAIFNQFETVRHYSLKKNVASTGLGLPIANQLVKLHGGRIEVESLLGSGSTFRAYLPVR